MPNILGIFPAQAPAQQQHIVYPPPGKWQLAAMLDLLDWCCWVPFAVAMPLAGSSTLGDMVWWGPVRCQILKRLKPVFMGLLNVYSLSQTILGIKITVSHSCNKHCKENRKWQSMKLDKICKGNATTA